MTGKTKATKGIVVTERTPETTSRRLIKNRGYNAAGRWQHSGGRVYLDEQYVANFVSVKRVTFNATSQQNTAALTITLLFIGEKPPQSITLQGTHDFSSGRQVGSISAASSNYAEYIGGSFTTENRIITIRIFSVVSD